MNKQPATSDEIFARSAKLLNLKEVARNSGISYDRLVKIANASLKKPIPENEFEAIKKALKIAGLRFDVSELRLFAGHLITEDRIFAVSDEARRESSGNEFEYIAKHISQFCQCCKVANVTKINERGTA